MRMHDAPLRYKSPHRSTCHLLLFVTSTFLLGIYFLPVAVFLGAGVKQVTTLPWIITPKGTIYGPIYGIYMG